MKQETIISGIVGLILGILIAPIFAPMMPWGGMMGNRDSIARMVSRLVRKLAAAKNPVRPSEGMAEGGCGGNSAMPERIELSPRHLPEYLEGRTPKKNVLSFLEEIGRAQIRKARNIFLWCRRVKRGGGGASSFVGVLRKMGSDFFKQTPQYKILAGKMRRSAVHVRSTHKSYPQGSRLTC